MRVVLSFTIAFWLMAWGTVTLADEELAPQAAQLTAWLAELDHDEFARREAAAQNLRAVGPRAIETLATGALAASPEVAWRSGEILKKIALDGDETTLQRVAAALASASNGGRPGMQDVIAELRARLHEMRRERAMAAIRQQGGQIATMPAGGAFGLDVGFMIGEPAFAAPLIVAEEELLIEAVEVAEVEVVERDEAEAAKVEATAKAATDSPDESDLREEKGPAEKGPEVRVPKAAPLAGETAEPAMAPAASEITEAPGLERPVIDLDAVVEKALRTVPKVDEAAIREALEERMVEGAIIIREPVLLEADVVEFFEPAIAFDAVPAPGGEAGSITMSLTLDANWRGGDAGLAALVDLPEIAAVSISKAKLTDQGLRHIARLPRLRSLQITETPFSADALRVLHREKPEANLFCQGSAMLGIHADRGGDCTLTSVYPGSGAAESGLRTGDKIVAIDDVEIRDFAELTIAVYTRQAGDKLQITYVRDGKQQTATVVLKPRAALEP
jgi:hypothetical protein